MVRPWSAREKTLIIQNYGMKWQADHILVCQENIKDEQSSHLTVNRRTLSFSTEPLDGMQTRLILQVILTK
jgi:hypothetical protein